MHTRNLIFLTKLLFIAVLFLGFNTALQASECYHYYTSKTYQLKNLNGKLFLEAIIKDPNKISIVSYRAILLKDVLPKNASIYSETRDGVVVKNDLAYYYIAKNSLSEKAVIIDQIADAKAQTLAPIGLTFFINGMWKKLNYHPYYPTSAQRVKFTLVKNVPRNARLFRTYFYGEHPVYLLKDNLHVYIFDEDEATLNTIENISPTSAKIDTLAENSDEFCIYDNNTFYLTRDNFRTVKDVTAQFKDRPLQQSFLKLKFYRPNSFRTYLDFQDGALWSYVSAGISLDQGGEVNFYRVGSSKYLESSGLVMHKGFLYEDPWDLVYENHPIDLPKSGNIKDYTLTTDGLYRLGNNIYKVRDLDGGSKLDKVEDAVSLEENAVMTSNNALWSYRHAIPQFYVTAGSISFYNYNTQKTDRTINHKSPLKDLKLAYAFDDQLLIENIIIPSVADYQSIEFLGSIVQVVSPCDGGRGQNEVVVNYDYYFKDKDGVYKYQSGDQGLVKLNDKNAIECTQDNFIETFYTSSRIN